MSILNQKFQTLLLWYKQRGLISPSYTELSHLANSNSETEQSEVSNQVVKPIEKLVINFLDGNSKDPKIIFVTANDRENSFSQEERNLFDKMLAAIQLKISNDVMIINIGLTTIENSNSDIPFDETIEKRKPKLIVPLDTKALDLIYFQKNKISGQWSDLRGEWLNYLDQSQVKMMATWHPRALIKHPPLKREAWDDLQKIQKNLSQ